MLPSDMNVNIKTGTAGYKNEILVSDSGFSLGSYDIANTSVPKKLATRHLSFKSIPPCQRHPQKSPVKTCLSHHAQRGKTHFDTCSGQCLRNMICFLIKGQNQGQGALLAFCHLGL